MIAYVETNFLLEVAYLREGHQACEAIIDLALSKSITLVLPSFCVTEARMAWQRQAKQRSEFHEKLTAQIRELSRSKPLADLQDKSRELTAALIKNSEEDRHRLDAVLQRVFQCAVIEPVSDATVKSAIDYENSLGLSPQDSLVYVSVLQHMQSDPSAKKCFLTKNSKDFANPDIYDELATSRCKLLTDFEDGLNYIQSTIR